MRGVAREQSWAYRLYGTVGFGAMALGQMALGF